MSQIKELVAAQMKQEKLKRTNQIENQFMGFINKMVTPNKIGQPDTGLDQKEEKEVKNDDEEYNPYLSIDIEEAKIEGTLDLV